MAVVVLKH